LLLVFTNIYNTPEIILEWNLQVIKQPVNVWVSLMENSYSNKKADSSLSQLIFFKATNC